MSCVNLSKIKLICHKFILSRDVLLQSIYDNWECSLQIIVFIIGYEMCHLKEKIDFYQKYLKYISLSQ